MPEKRRPWRADAVTRLRAVSLRQEMTPAEKLLWGRLRDRRLRGLKFRRQHPIGDFVVDFYCAAARLIVEVDGPVHVSQRERDAERQLRLEASGYRLFRCTNEDVEGNVDSVLEEIVQVCGV